MKTNAPLFIGTNRVSSSIIIHHILKNFKAFLNLYQKNFVKPAKFVQTANKKQQFAQTFFVRGKFVSRSCQTSFFHFSY